MAAAASLAYYQDKKVSEGWPIIVVPTGSTPSSSDNPGVLHNVVCSNYLNGGFGAVNFDDIKAVGIQVKPGLESEINAIDEQFYNVTVNWAVTVSLETVPDQVAMIEQYVSLSDSDKSTLSDGLQNIMDGTEAAWPSNVDLLITDVQSMSSVSTEHKEWLTSSFEILKHSHELWSS